MTTCAGRNQQKTARGEAPGQPMVISCGISQWTVRITLLITVGLLIGCATRDAHDVASRHIQLSVQRLSNDDIEWNGNIFGLSAEIRGNADTELLNADRSADAVLLDALADPEKYAAAHVLLTMIHAEPYKVSGGEWNGLKVDLLANGQTILFPVQRFELQRSWRQKLSASTTRSAR